jgi:hypothetical protein
MLKYPASLVAVLFLCGLISTCGLAWAATKEPITEQVVATAVPDNNLVLDVLSTNQAGLELIDPAPVIAASVPAARLSVPKSFWNSTENTLFTASLVAFAGMNVADYFLTREALKYPEAGETNPLLQPIVKNAVTFALFKIGYIVLNTTGLSSMHETDKPMAWALSIATNLLATLAITHNIHQLDKVKNH